MPGYTVRIAAVTVWAATLPVYLCMTVARGLAFLDSRHLVIVIGVASKVKNNSQGQLALCNLAITELTSFYKEPIF